jgi:hypothetical protein
MFYHILCNISNDQFILNSIFLTICSGGHNHSNDKYNHNSDGQ